MPEAGLIRLARLIAFPAAFVLTILAVTAASGAEPYRLAENDRIRVHVYGWSDISGEYRVGPDGIIGLPLAGAVPVNGLTLPEAGDTIADRLTPMLASRPSTTVEMATYRPVYVIGAVAAPGAYEYAPGMTVLQAVALAGGFGSAAATLDDGRRKIEILREREILEQSLLEQQRLEALHARLLAERDGDPLTAPDAEATSRAGNLMSAEQTILDLRSEALANSITLLEQQAQQYREELDFLDSQLASKHKESDLLRQLLADQEELLGLGLVRQSRLVEFQRQVVASEGETYDISALQQRARQNMTRVEQEISERRSARKSEITLALQDVENQLAVTNATISAKRALLTELGALETPASALRFHIVRPDGEGHAGLTADATTRMEPDDVLEVRTAPVDTGLALVR
jgi:polysaccharide biosynthesis/export protein ExoF